MVRPIGTPLQEAFFHCGAASRTNKNYHTSPYGYTLARSNKETNCTFLAPVTVFRLRKQKGDSCGARESCLHRNDRARPVPTGSRKRMDRLPWESSPVHPLVFDINEFFTKNNVFQRKTFGFVSATSAVLSPKQLKTNGFLRKTLFSKENTVYIENERMHRTRFSR